MAKLLEKTRKITSILKRSEEQLQEELPYNAITRQLADIIHCNACIINRIALRKDIVDGCDRHAQSYFFRIYAAELVVRTRGSRKLLRNHILKIDTRIFKTERIYIRDVVADDVHARLVIL